MTELEFYRDKRVLVTGHTGLRAFGYASYLKRLVQRSSVCLIVTFFHKMKN